MFWQTAYVHGEYIKKSISISVCRDKFVFIVVLTNDGIEGIKEFFEFILFYICLEFVVVLYVYQFLLSASIFTFNIIVCHSMEWQYFKVIRVFLSTR